VLFPVAVLIVFVLAGLAADTAVAFNARHQVADVASTAANDAATALADADFYTSGDIVHDRAQLEANTAAAVTSRTEGGDPAEVGLRITCDPAQLHDDGISIEVVCRGRVRLLFWRVGWLGLDARTVSASATATAVER
jgi:Flp pilus assembly protein TadG